MTTRAHTHPVRSTRALERPAVRDAARTDLVELWGVDSFPASDPPANW